MRNSSLTYGSAARTLHWINSLLLVIVWLTSNIEDDSTLFYWGHIILGLVALVFTALQIIWHFADKTPDPLPDLSNWRKNAIKWNHWLIMFTALILAISGVILWQTDNAEDLHELLSTALVLLFVMHLGGIFLYQFTKGNALKRMGINL